MGYECDTWGGSAAGYENAMEELTSSSSAGDS